MTIQPTIWDDINHEAEAIVIRDTKYDLGSLSDSTYEVIDDPKKRRTRILTSNVKGLFKDLNLIRQHRSELESDDKITDLIRDLFKPSEHDSITGLDRLFLNCYYRRLLRAKVERDFKGKELVPGLVVTKYENHETDAPLVATMRYLRVICRYLGIESTTEAATFPVEKLYMPKFWSSMSEKFVGLFGETRVVPIEVVEELPSTCIEDVMEFDARKRIGQVRVLAFLNIIMNTWSGSTLSFVESAPRNKKKTRANSEVCPKMVKLVPATYVTRMLPKLR